MDSDFDQLFRVTYAPLVRALSVAAGRAEAADAVQDAFVQALRHWARVSTYDRPETWVRRVAVNRLTDRHRRLRRQREVVPTLAQDLRPADPRPADLDLAEAVEALPQGQRVAVCLYYLADLPVDEVGKVMGISVGTVKSQLHDARRSLARTLGASHGT